MTYPCKHGVTRYCRVCEEDNAARPLTPLHGRAALPKHDAVRLNSVAQLIDKEVLCWKEGFCAWIKGQWVWTKEYPDVQARVIRLESGAQFLRRLSAQHIKRHNTPSAA